MKKTDKRGEPYQEKSVPSTAARCPLCHGLNGCHIAAGKPAQDCWCQTVKVPDGLLAQLPANRRYQSCLCKNCIDNYRQQHNEKGQ